MLLVGVFGGLIGVYIGYLIGYRRGKWHLPSELYDIIKEEQAKVAQETLERIRRR